jgi:hypothetical protein
VSKLVKVAAAVIALAVLLSGCRLLPSEPIEVGVIVTRSFGNGLLLDERVTVDDGSSARDALEQAASVETAYGGGFITAINGVPSTAGEDWFFYVNGILTNVGAGGYALHEGDVERWDFHSWGFYSFVSALVGDFPEPFVHGYGGEVCPAVVVYQPGLEDEAGDVAGMLARLGVGNVSAVTAAELSPEEKEWCNLILLGALDCELVSELNQLRDELCFYAYFEGGELLLLDSRGEVAGEYGAGCGLIQAAQSPWNPGGIGACQNVVWMVSGTDEAGVRDAADVLVNRSAELRHAFAAVIAGGEVIKVPQ